MCRSNSDDALPGSNRRDRMVCPPHTPAGNRPARSHQGRLEIEKDGPHTGLNPGDRHRFSRPPPVASTTTSRRLYVQVNIYRRQVMQNSGRSRLSRSRSEVSSLLRSNHGAVLQRQPGAFDRPRIPNCRKSTFLGLPAATRRKHYDQSPSICPSEYLSPTSYAELGALTSEP